MTSDRNYVAAWNDWRADEIVVLERDLAGHLFKKKYNPPYYFYVPDETGDYESIWGDKLIRAEFSSRDEYEEAKQQFPVKFESDISPLKRVLMDYYYNVPAPLVHYAFLDIEVDYAKSIGWARPTNPYAQINAVTVYQSWTKKYLTLVIPPLVDGVLWTNIPGNSVDTLYDAIKALIADKQLRDDIIPEIQICSNEHELLCGMLACMEDADIISGWNSEFFDIPYIAERLLLAGGESLLAKLEHQGVRPPKKEMVNRFGTEEPIYKFTGRSHLDYMKLFQKFTFEGRTSYALGNILQEEVGIGKLEYEGSLEDLFKYNFPLFVAYNFRDVDGLVQLDSKFKFIALANQMAHENTVGFDAVLGTVAYVETGITNHAHYVLDKIVHDKTIGSHDPVEGAIVMTPKIGLHKWIGSVDINSLYPNVIRSLNISPEKIIGQFYAKEEAWRDIWDGKTDKRHCLIFEDGSQEIMSADKWAEWLTENKCAMSAYGTVFDQGNGRGVVADILGFWYNERKRLQAEKKKYAKLAKDEADAVKKKEYKKLEEDFDLLQLTKKISMNSLYGAMLNVAFRFGDERAGASVTATGRAITTHMIETIGKVLSGTNHILEKKYDPEEKEKKKAHKAHKDRNAGDNAQLTLEEWDLLPTAKPLVSMSYKEQDDDYGSALYRAVEYLPDGRRQFSEVIIYGDTDSCYYICKKAVDKSSAIEIADRAAEFANASFPTFMKESFKCQPEFDQLIKAGREIVGIRGLFQAKKKYMVKVVDLEGFAVDKMKSMGSEIKKADTPKVIQKFLKETVDMILEGKSYDDVVKYVNEQRIEILKKNKLEVFSLGVAKQVNNLDKYMAEYLNPGTQKYLDKNGKMRTLTIPGHVMAAMNYNTAIQTFDKGSKEINSGDKVVIFYLKPNEAGFETLAFPAEFSKFPQWFTDNFQVNIKLTENRMFDSKLAGIFSALNKDVPSPQSVLTNKLITF
jgi:DNA polymerase elongation subunit (family B)